MLMLWQLGSFPKGGGDDSRAVAGSAGSSSSAGTGSSSSSFVAEMPLEVAVTLPPPPPLSPIRARANPRVCTALRLALHAVLHTESGRP
jgi:hypothetical protein